MTWRTHDSQCEAVMELDRCDCAARADTHRIQEENRIRLEHATDTETADVIGWLNDWHPDILRDAMNETGDRR